MFLSFEGGQWSTAQLRTRRSSNPPMSRAFVDPVKQRCCLGLIAIGLTVGLSACTASTREGGEAADTATVGSDSAPLGSPPLGSPPFGSDTGPQASPNPSGSNAGGSQEVPVGGTRPGLSSEAVGPGTLDSTAINSPPATGAPDEGSTSNLGPIVPDVEGALGVFVCPPPPYATKPVADEATAVRVPGVPPADEFASTSDTVILEGPVWSGGVLYLSQINSGTPVFGRPGSPPTQGADAGSSAEDDDAGPAQPLRPPPSRMLAVNSVGEVSVLFEDLGSNGLAVDGSGRLLAANHKSGGVTVVPLDGSAELSLVATYEGVRFNSPNDLTVGRDGSIYFTDPDYQAPVPAPQAQTRVYRVAPGSGTAVAIGEERRQPNGITLSPGGETLYVSASDGLVAYAVAADGTVGAGSAFAEGVVRTSDGMAVDCAGNLYTTSGQSVIVVDRAGAEVARITVPDVQSVTNVAFGGPESRTLYITSLGSGSRVGLYQLTAEVPGMPY